MGKTPSALINKNENLFDHIAKAISESSGGEIDSKEIILTTPPSPDLGDYAFGCFKLAKQWKISPDKAAEKLAGAIKPSEIVAGAKASGPYLNIELSRNSVSNLALQSVLASGDKYGYSKDGAGEVVMMEYVSPNTNKPLHLGHIRNGLIGWSVAEIIKTQGSKVFKTDIINDRGIHIMKSLLAYERWGKGETPKSTGIKGDHFVGKYYVQFEIEYQKEFTEWLGKKNINLSSLDEKEKDETKNQFLEQSELILATHELLKKWEAGDKATIALWKKMNQWVYDGFKETYQKLGLDFDRHYYESQIYQGGKEIILDALKKGLLEKTKDGAVVAPLGKPPELFPVNLQNPNKTTPLTEKVVLRADGTGLYVTQDINLATIKFKDFKLTQSLYCVGSEQDYYMQQLFAILKLLKFPRANGLHHLTYGMVYLPEGKMKSREGRVVDADELIEKMISLAKETLRERYPDLSEKEINHRAEVIGLGALKFHFLVVSRNTPICFDPKASLSFEGKTGPYLQYSYARASSIIRKAKKISPPKTASVSNNFEWQIILRLINFPKVLSNSSKEYDAAGLANYLIDLSQEFNTFYHNTPVLETKEDEVRQTRLAIVNAFRKVVGEGLAILGIETLEEM